MELVASRRSLRLNDYPHNFRCKRQRVMIAMAMSCILIIDCREPHSPEVTVQAQNMNQVTEIQKKSNGHMWNTNAWV
jgi:ABC-type microcin C transport system duplicated ATPase subunit YejF